MKFVLEIEMGNEAMQDSMDVAAALHHVGTTLEMSGLPARGDKRSVHDPNGSTVGTYALVLDSEEADQ
jgi:hypothetical protein